MQVNHVSYKPGVTVDATHRLSALKMQDAGGAESTESVGNGCS